MTIRRCDCELYLYNDSPFIEQQCDRKRCKYVILTYSPNYVDIRTGIIMSGMSELFASRCGNCKNMPFCFGYYLTMTPSSDWRLECEYIEGEHGIELSYKQAYFNTAGQFLNKFFRENNISRDEFYITSVVKCMTPADRAPTIAEIKACNARLMRELSAIEYDCIIAFGKLSTYALFSRIYEIDEQIPRYNDKAVYVTYNPSDVIKLNLARIQAYKHKSNKYKYYTEQVRLRSAHIKSTVLEAIGR